MASPYSGSGGRYLWGLRFMQLEEVVSGAEETPLGLHVDEPAPEELAEPARAFDLSEDGLDSLFAQLIDRLAFVSCEQVTHGITVRPASR